MRNLFLPSEHVTVAGITGGGKSVFCESYLSQMPKVIKLDIKGEALYRVLRKKEHPWRGVSPKELVIVQTLEDVMKAQEPYVIYCPVVEEQELPIYNELFRYIYHDRKFTGTVTWIDEGMSVSDSHNITQFNKYLLTQGRFQDTGVWTCTQRPVGINPLSLSQSTHIVSFDLPRKSDRKFLAEGTGVDEFLDMPEGYNFWYFRRGWRRAQKGVLQL